jgi:hypothetical protein
MEIINDVFAGVIWAAFGVDYSTGDSFKTDKDYILTMESMFLRLFHYQLSLLFQIKRIAFQKKLVITQKN